MKKNSLLFVSVTQIISCKCSLVFSSRIGTESGFGKINETLGDIFSKLSTGIKLHWAPVSI